MLLLMNHSPLGSQSELLKPFLCSKLSNMFLQSNLGMGTVAGGIGKTRLAMYCSMFKLGDDNIKFILLLLLFLCMFGK